MQISNPDKVLFPDDGLTKADLAGYYERMAEAMLHGCATPGGRTQPGAPFPLLQHLCRANTAGEVTGHVLLHDALAAQPVGIADHGGGPHARVPGRPGVHRSPRVPEPGRRLRQPDQLIFDLDPPEDAPFGQVVDVATELRSLLETELRFAAFVKTTGGHGLHVHVPLSAADDFEAARDFALQVARTLADRLPDLATTEQRRASRGGRIYLDVMRNAYAQLAVAPYSVRARPAAPVATPLGSRFGLSRARRAVARMAA